MKNLMGKITIPFLSLFMLTAILTSCGIDEKDLIGKWKLVSQEINKNTDFSSEQIKNMEADAKYNRYDFKEDGTLLMSGLNHKNTKGNWSLDGSILTVDITSTTSEMVELGEFTNEILSISEDELVLFISVNNGIGKEINGILFKHIRSIKCI